MSRDSTIVPLRARIGNPLVACYTLNDQRLKGSLMRTANEAAVLVAVLGFALLSMQACSDDPVRVGAPPAPRSVTTFEWYNPLTPATDLHAIAPAGGGGFVTVGEHGTILRSRDGGLSWTLQAASQFSEGLRGVHFLDATTGMVVGSNGFVARTDDGGDTWTRVADASTYGLYDVFMLDQDTAVVAGIGTIARTTDGGATWTPSTVSDPLGLGLVCDVDFPTPTRGIATFPGSSGFDVFVSEDAGRSWVRRSSPLCAANDFGQFWFVDQSIGYAVSIFLDRDCAGFFSTTDGGSTWEARGPVGTRWTDILFLDELHGLAVNDGYVDETTDGGFTWTRVVEFPIRRLQRLAVSDDAVVAIGNGGNIIRSADRGKTWLRHDNARPNWPSLGQVTFENTADPSRWVVSTGLVLLFTEDGGVNWIQRPMPSASQYVDFFDHERGMMGFSHWRTINGGRTWEPIARPLNAALDFTAFEELAQGDVIAVGGDTYDRLEPAIIRRSVDFGDSWTLLFDSGVASNLFVDVEFADAMVGYVIGSESLARTADGGATWTEITTVKGNAVITLNPQTALVGGSPGIWRTTDAGETWVQADLRYVQAFAFYDEQFGYGAGSDGLLLTTDGGESWTDVPTPAYAIYDVAFVTSDRIFVSPLSQEFSSAPVVFLGRAGR